MQKNLALLMAILVLFSSPKPNADTKHSEQPLSAEVLQQLPQRVSHLKPGMTRNQVWRTLALPVYYQHLGGYGSGPPQSYAEIHQIGHYTLCLIFNEPHLKSYTLASDPHMWNGGWYKSAKELHQAERGLVRTN